MYERKGVHFSYAQCAYWYNNWMFIRRYMYSNQLLSYFYSENLKKSDVWHLHWDSHSPWTWTLLTWPTFKNVNSIMRCNWKNDCIHSVPLLKPMVGSDGFPKMNCLNLYGNRTVLLYQYLGNKAVPKPVHGSL